MTATLGVQEQGGAGALALVFLHGVGADASSWDREIGYLQDFHCLAVDLPGHGRSAAGGWTSLEDTADEVAKLIEARCAAGRAVVVGLSLGGAICYALLARHPQVVRKAVIDGASVSATRAAPLMKAAVAAVSPLLHHRWVIRMLASTLDLPEGDLPGFGQALRRVHPRSFRRAFADAQDPGVLEEVLRCEVPILLVAGEHEMSDIHAMNAALAAAMPRTQPGSPRRSDTAGLPPTPSSTRA